MTRERPVLVVTGLAAEARIAAAPGVATLAGGGDASALQGRIEAALRDGAAAVISFGIAGGLRPRLAPGTAIVARAVRSDGTRLETHAAWTQVLAGALPEAVLADLVGVDVAVTAAAAKADLHHRTGAAAVDMESHVAARCADAARLPFAALRIVCDPAHRSLPAAALVGMKPDGSTDVLAVLRSLGRAPGQLPGLVRTALDARAAFASLRTNRRELSARFGLDDDCQA